MKTKKYYELTITKIHEFNIDDAKDIFLVPDSKSGMSIAVERKSNRQIKITFEADDVTLHCYSKHI